MNYDLRLKIFDVNELYCGRFYISAVVCFKFYKFFLKKKKKFIRNQFQAEKTDEILPTKTYFPETSVKLY